MTTATSHFHKSVLIGTASALALTFAAGGRALAGEGNPSAVTQSGASAADATLPGSTPAELSLEEVLAAYEFHDDKFEVAAYVHNLSNQKYYIDMFDLGSPFGFIEGIRGVPRTVGAEVNYRF